MKEGEILGGFKAHGIVGAICRVTFDNMLHGKDASNRSKGRGFSKGVTGVDDLFLNKALQFISSKVAFSVTTRAI